MKRCSSKTSYPPRRWGFVNKYKRIWYPSFHEQSIPITSYCNRCKGIKRPIGSPFCNECKLPQPREEVNTIQKLSFDIFLHAMGKKIEEREISLEVVKFVSINFNDIVSMIIKDRIKRGLNSTKIN